VYKIHLYMLSQNRFIQNHKNQNCATTPVCMWQYDFVTGSGMPCSAEVNPLWKYFTYEFTSDGHVNTQTNRQSTGWPIIHTKRKNLQKS
jgi:hypothetical protein